MAKKYLTHINLSGNELQNAVVQPLASAPSSPKEGQIYFNTTSNKFMVFNGSTWDEMGSSSATGDMSASVYDPQNVQDDAFDVDNHTDGTSFKRYSAAEKTKLSGVATGATANSTDEYLLARANHTGTQAISTVSGLQTALDGKAASSHSHTSSDISDFTTAVTSIADASAAAIVDAAPGTLDTLNELAAALGDDPNFATTISGQIGDLDTRIDAVEANGGPTKKYSETVGGSTSITVTHNLGSQDVITQVRQVSDNAVVECDITNATTNTVTLGFASAPAASSLKVTVIG